MFVKAIDSPVGPIWLTGDGEAITGLYFRPRQGEAGDDQPLLKKAERQLREYFAGQRQQFTLPLRPEGTAFQRGVWRTLMTIPYGETATYGAIAAKVGNPKACRAVGMANNRNPISIFIPCHRVVGSGGALVGYGGGLAVKEYLLELERKGRG